MLMSATVIPSLQAALIPLDPPHVPPITFGGHSVTATNQVDASQRANLVVVTLVGVFMIVGLLTCAFYVCLRQRIHRFCRSLRRRARSTPPPPTKRPRNESDLRDLEETIRQILVTQSLRSPPRTLLPYLYSPPLSPVEGYPTVQCPLDNGLPGPVPGARREDGQRELIPAIRVSLPFPDIPRSQSVPRMLSVYGRQASIQTSRSPSTSPVPTAIALYAQEERRHFYIVEESLNSEICSSPTQEHQSLIPTIAFQPYSPSLDSGMSSPIEPASPHLPLWSERLISRSSCASSLLSNVRSSTGSFLVHSKIESMMDLQRTGTPSEDSAVTTLPVIGSEPSSGWRFSSSSGISGTTSEGVGNSQETTYPALSALIALVVGYEAETETETETESEDVHQTLRLLGAGDPSTPTIPSFASDEFVEISLSSEPPLPKDADSATPSDVDTVPTDDHLTKKSGRQRTPESRLMSQLIDELTGGSGGWKSYDEFFGISQDDLVDSDEPTPSSTPDTGTPLSATFSLPSTPTNVTFLPPRVPSRPIGRQPTFIGMDWDRKRTSTHINLPQRMPAARTRSSHPLSLILEVDSSESASLYSQDHLHDSANVSHSSSTSETTIRERAVTRVGNDDDLRLPLQSNPFSTAPSRNLIRPLILGEKYPKPRPLTLDAHAGALPQSQSCLESMVPSIGLCLLADTDLETRKRMGVKPPTPRPILPDDLEAVYPSAQDNMDNQPDGATSGLGAVLGKLLGFGAEIAADSRNAVG